MHFREHWKIFPVSTLVGVFVGILWCALHRKKSTFVGISVDIFVYTPVCIFVSNFVRELVGQNPAVRVLCACLRDMAGEMAGSHFSGVPKMPEKWWAN